MVLLFTCGRKAHTPVMYADSEQSWNGGRMGKIIIPWGGIHNFFLFIMCVFNLTFQGENQLLLEI